MTQPGSQTATSSLRPQNGWGCSCTDCGTEPSDQTDLLLKRQPRVGNGAIIAILRMTSPVVLHLFLLFWLCVVKLTTQRSPFLEVGSSRWSRGQGLGSPTDASEIALIGQHGLGGRLALRVAVSARILIHRRRFAWPAPTKRRKSAMLQCSARRLLILAPGSFIAFRQIMYHGEAPEHNTQLYFVIYPLALRAEPRGSCQANSALATRRSSVAERFVTNQVPFPHRHPWLQLGKVTTYNEDYVALSGCVAEE